MRKNPTLRFITILLIEILSGVEVDLFIPSFPELQRVFELSPFMVQLTLSVNFIAYCVCCLFAGTMGDRYNRRHVMLAGLLIFVIGSLFCMFASHFSLLVLGRFLQGMGIAAPATLAFVVIADEYPIKKQPALLGLLNGIVTVAMAFAPVIGSIVNLYFNWRANFALLLGLGIICLIASYFLLPNKQGNTGVSLSPRAYLPLINSQKFMLYLVAICFLAITYWIFVGMAPILYMQNLGVDLAHFGYYQGAMAAAFSVVSMLSPAIYKRFGHGKSFKMGLWLCAFSAVLIILITVLDVKDPLLITAVVVIFSIGVVAPVNILYPVLLGLVYNTKGRAAALVQAGRLILTAIGLQTVSYFYVDGFFPIGISMFVSLIIGLYFCSKIMGSNLDSILSSEDKNA
jgi:DHA1 family bicyclomycin/chloramphenicol resistance-like MFS transporter